jgi:hypothetical protein
VTAKPFVQQSKAEEEDYEEEDYEEAEDGRWDDRKGKFVRGKR